MIRLLATLAALLFLPLQSGCEKKADPAAALLADVENYLSSRVAERQEGDLAPQLRKLLQLPESEQLDAETVELLRQTSTCHHATIQYSAPDDAGLVQSLTIDGETVNLVDVARLFMSVNKRARLAVSAGRADDARTAGLGLLSIQAAMHRSMPVSYRTPSSGDRVSMTNVGLSLLRLISLELLEWIQANDAAAPPDPALDALLARWKIRLVE